MNTSSDLNGTFSFQGKMMKNIYSDIVDKAWGIQKYKEKIQTRTNKDSFRYFEFFDRFMHNNFSGNLSKSAYNAAIDLNYDVAKYDLFHMSEDLYKQKHPEEYDNLYTNLDDKGKLDKFWCADFGKRTPFELEQDVMVSTLFEDMLVYYGQGELKPNKDATGRGTKKVTTNCDLVYCTPLELDEHFEIPLEIKTKWKYTIEDSIDMRGNSNNVIQSNGMVLTIYMNLNKAILIDFGGNNKIESTRGVMAGDKDCDKIKVDPNNFIEFCFWKEDDMKKMLNIIYKTYKERETK